MVSHIDIAKAAGVSASKVSRALNDKNINRDEAERIKAVAQQMGYHGNRMAKGIKTGRSHIIGCLLTNRLNPWDSELLSGIQEAAMEAGYLTTFADWSHSPDESLRMLLEFQTDGLILTSIVPHDISVIKNLLSFTTSGRPLVVTYDWPLEDSWGSVAVNFEEAAICLVNHLVDLGHRHIAFAGGWVISQHTNPRLSGFMKGLATNKCALDPRFIFMSPEYTDTFEGGMALGARLASMTDRPTAVIAYNDIMAIGIIRALLERGLRVPEDMSVCGFDGLKIGSYGIPSLTTIDTNTVSWGKNLFHALLTMRDGHDIVKRPQPWQFVTGGSTSYTYHI